MAEQTTGERLVELRNRLEALLEEAGVREAPALAREYRAVLAELEKRGATEEASAVDDLATRRASRIAAAKSPAKATARKRGGGRGGDRPS